MNINSINHSTHLWTKEEIIHNGRNFLDSKVRELQLYPMLLEQATLSKQNDKIFSDLKIALENNESEIANLAKSILQVSIEENLDELETCLMKDVGQKANEVTKLFTAAQQAAPAYQRRYIANYAEAALIGTFALALPGFVINMPWLVMPFFPAFMASMYCGYQQNLIESFNDLLKKIQPQ
jgi:hypothetical protein